MDIGVKIASLRKSKKLSQPELAHILGISQTALCNIESGKTKKIDFLLMNKVCKEFEVGFSYFIDDKQVNNFKKNKGTVPYRVDTINNSPENIINQIKRLIKDSKQKDETIAELKASLKHYDA